MHTLPSSPVRAEVADGIGGTGGGAACLLQQGCSWLRYASAGMTGHLGATPGAWSSAVRAPPRGSGGAGMRLASA
eukprot:267703-Chlamydomonas_euryale.AAC.2